MVIRWNVERCPDGGSHVPYNEPGMVTYVRCSRCRCLGHAIPDALAVLLAPNVKGPRSPSEPPDESNVPPV